MFVELAFVAMFTGHTALWAWLGYQSGIRAPGHPPNRPQDPPHGFADHVGEGDAS